MTHWRQPTPPPPISQALLAFIVAMVMLIILVLGIHLAHARDPRELNPLPAQRRA